MRYSQGHKAQTHKRIIKEASIRFRRTGIGATGLQHLMKALNLTHGEFYSHFKSKHELVEKALQAAAAELDAHCECCSASSGR
jgi:AcrR family transcriptional regulator